MPTQILPNRVREFCKNSSASDHATAAPSAPGVYVIFNTGTLKSYIGTTSDIARRFCAHKSDLRGGRHHNTRLQEDWNLCGESAFTFSVFALVGVEESNALEKELIAESLGDSCYNWSVTAGMGRPLLPAGDLKKPMAVRLSDSQYAAFKALGGVSWLQGQCNLEIQRQTLRGANLPRGDVE